LSQDRIIINIITTIIAITIIIIIISIITIVFSVVVQVVKLLVSGDRTLANRRGLGGKTPLMYAAAKGAIKVGDLTCVLILLILMIIMRA
jgi:hypothetical protein